MVTGNDGVLKCPKRDGTELKKDTIDTLPLNEIVRDLVHMLDHSDSSPSVCYRCETDIAEYWCESDCKHSFCSKCWDTIHELGQYRNHTQLPISEKPPDIARCQEHEQGDDTLKYWCEQCTKQVCNNCQQIKHKDHPFILVTDFMDALQEECEDGLQGVQSCLTYRSNRVEKMVTEIEEEKKSNKSKVVVAMDSFRKIIDEQEKALLENIDNTEREEMKSVEEYKRQLQGEHQNLIEEVLNFVVVCTDKQPKKQFDAKSSFDDYIKRTKTKLLELKPKIRNGNHIPGLQKLQQMEEQIRSINMEKVPKYENRELQDAITKNGNNSTLNLQSIQLTDKDMAIVANLLENNRTLTTLQLKAEELKGFGAQQLADALRINEGTRVENRKITFVIEAPPRPPYDNPELRKRFVDNGNRARLDLSGSHLTDRDMEIVADVLKTNTKESVKGALEIVALTTPAPRTFAP
ncbi:unnamed protein product [Adineta steineri]|uniref:B box-type domain-containing protein n=1 Tax=Adineta steineri TaxID=433720 RepID=A0A814UUW5_9BILA|nr:unnamed protein product [Adineta steineri]CAF3793238.1 unnamed protein product [Adineta steineri]